MTLEQALQNVLIAIRSLQANAEQHDILRASFELIKSTLEKGVQDAKSETKDKSKT